MLRIGIFTYTLPTDGAGTEASARAAHDLAQGLALRGHDVRVWTFGHTPPDVLYEVRELPFSTVFRTRIGRLLLDGFLGHLMSLVPDYRDREAVLCFGDGLFLPLKHRNVVRVLHGSAIAEARAARSMLRAMLGRVRYGIELMEGAVHRSYPYSRFLGASATTKGLNPYVRGVIPEGVDRTVFFPVPEEKSPEPSILFIGRLTGASRGMRLLRWFHQEVRPRVPTARLLVVGPAGPALPNVEYRFPVDAATLAMLHRRAWVFACPSIYEPSGLRYLEAMASGTVVLATPNSGSRDALGDGKFGVLAEDDTFPKALVTLLGDEKARRAWAERGQQRAAELDLASTLTAYEDLLRNMVMS